MTPNNLTSLRATLLEAMLGEGFGTSEELYVDNKARVLLDNIVPVVEAIVAQEVRKAEFRSKIEGLESYSHQCGMLRMEPSTIGLKRYIKQMRAGWMPPVAPIEQEGRNERL